MDKLRRIVDWTKIKIRIESGNDTRFYFHDREIWWASLGSNVGFEQDGKNTNFERPVLVVKKFNRNMLWVLPLTSHEKVGFYYHTFEIDKDKYTVILPQLRLISSRRLIRKMR
ncbi:type II toxin-antitoxin system PemK/MazF family toxin, partial [Candidatus Parcubacteria bacterium]|nr:type II toxin-antitoxin system PemK/MazF family toxin [Candidatus Parcubacteria bacterium]